MRFGISTRRVLTWACQIYVTFAHFDCDENGKIASAFPFKNGIHVLGTFEFLTGIFQLVFESLIETRGPVPKLPGIDKF